MVEDRRSTSRHRDRIDGIVVTHGPDDLLDVALAALVPQVRRTVVVANVPGSPAEAPPGGTLIENDHQRGFAANVNRGASESDAEFLAIVNPDAVLDPGALDVLIDVADECPRAGILGPQLRYPDGTWQPTRRRFPTVTGTLARRLPGLGTHRRQQAAQAHYLADQRPTGSTQADWLLGACLVVRRAAFVELRGFDEGYRLYCEDIDLCYRARRLGWETWFVPGATAMHGYHAEIDRGRLNRRTWWHVRSMARYARRHPEVLLRRSDNRSRPCSG